MRASPRQEARAEEGERAAGGWEPGMEGSAAAETSQSATAPNTDADGALCDGLTLLGAAVERGALGPAGEFPIHHLRSDRIAVLFSHHDEVLRSHFRCRRCVRLTPSLRITCGFACRRATAFPAVSCRPIAHLTTRTS